MGFLNILVAAVVSFAAGAVWYMALANPWMDAASIERGPDGKPVGDSPVLYLATFVLQLIVATMMAHVFASAGVVTICAGVLSGLGIGLFFITPWIAINNLYCGRPVLLTAIDGGYATFACSIMGAIMVLF